MEQEKTHKSEKKRKRHKDSLEKPHKKHAPESKTNSIKVSHIAADEEWAPVIATAPGLELPPKFKMQAYRRDSANAGTGPRELHLHSGEHPRLNYTAREHPAGSPESLLKHYVGVYNEERQKLVLVEARHMLVRSTLRAEDEEMQSEQHKQSQLQSQASQSGFSKYQALGLEFGSKKAKRSIARYTENAIGPGKSANASKDGSQNTNAAQPASASAVLSSMALSEAAVPSKEERQAAIADAKAKPKHDPAATKPAEVYKTEELIGRETMAACKVKPWIDAVYAEQDVQTSSRFVSHRLQKLAEDAGDENIAKLKVLRYMLLLLELVSARSKGKSGAGRLPGMDKLRERTRVDGELLDTVRSRFSADGQMTKWHVDKLRMHLAALSLTVDDYETDISDLRDDLVLDNSQMTKYYREIGARVKTMTPRERDNAKLTAGEASNVRIARLQLPLEFPKSKRLDLAKGRR